MPAVAERSTRAAVFIVDSGKTLEIEGLPADGCLTDAFRLPASDNWALVWQPTAASEQCDAARGQLYIVDGATAVAGPIRPAEQIAPADHDSVWVLSNAALPPAQQVAASEVAVRITIRGAAVSPTYVVPPGWAVVRGLSPDLLLLARQLPSGDGDWETWQPSSGRVTGRFSGVLAANRDIVVSNQGNCVTRSCPVRVTSLVDGSDRTVTLPRDAYAFSGALSTDGRYLALDLSAGADASGATNRDMGVVVALNSLGVHAIPQASVPAGETGGLDMHWTATAWVMLQVIGGADRVQLAAYSPETGALVVLPRPPLAGMGVVF